MRIALTCGLAALCLSDTASAEPASRPADMLAAMAADYESDPLAIAPLTFAVRVGEETWTVATTRADEGAGVAATVTEGVPAEPTWVLATDVATFARIYRGDLSAATAMAQARASDPTPMTLEMMDGYTPEDDAFAPEAEFRDVFMSVLMHFFARGAPEVSRFGMAHSRVVHGAHAVPLYYGEGVRSSWYGIAPGQHVNEDPDDQVNSFHSIVVVISGVAWARLGRREMTLRAGESVFVPSGMAHEFWNDGDESIELILLMVGEGA